MSRVYLSKRIPQRDRDTSQNEIIECGMPFFKVSSEIDLLHMMWMTRFQSCNYLNLY